jgi:hypothetical protein
MERRVVTAIHGMGLLTLVAAVEAVTPVKLLIILTQWQQGVAGA